MVSDLQGTAPAQTRSLQVQVNSAGADTITITAGPTAATNPVSSGGQTQLSITASDSQGHTLGYSWSSPAGTFSNATIANPVWTAPTNTTGTTQTYTLSVTVSDLQGSSPPQNRSLPVQVSSDCGLSNSETRSGPSCNLRVLGIDASSSVDWPEVKRDGKQFAFLRASSGACSQYADYLNNNERDARDLLVGVYHFAYPNYESDCDGPTGPKTRMKNTAVREATNFLSAAKPYVGQGYLPPVLDIENCSEVTDGSAGDSWGCENVENPKPNMWGCEKFKGPNNTPGPAGSPDDLAKWIKDWAAEVFNKTLVRPLIYTNGECAKILNSASAANRKDLAEYGLWIASGSRDPDNPGVTIDPWLDWKFHQYELHNDRPDLDSFKGDLATLNRLAHPPFQCLVSVNQLEVSIGNTLTTAVACTNPGLVGNADTRDVSDPTLTEPADFFTGLLLSDGSSLAFFTDPNDLGKVAFGSVGDVSSFSSIAAGASLAMPFTLSIPSFFSYQLIGSEPLGDYVFFLFVVRAGALANGFVTSGEIAAALANGSVMNNNILGFSRAPFSVR